MSALDEIRKHSANHNATPKYMVDDLLAVIEAITALHKPEKRWMTYEGADVSYDSEAEAREWMDGDEPEGELPFFEVCAECKSVEEGPCDGECILELGYRQCIWPCTTNKAITKALGGAA